VKIPAHEEVYGVFDQNPCRCPYHLALLIDFSFPYFCFLYFSRCWSISSFFIVSFINIVKNPIELCSDMPTAPVHFSFRPATPDWPTGGSIVELRGSWDSAGKFSNNWSSITMNRAQGPDLCAEFTVTVSLDLTENRRWFSWGVAIRESDREVWAIPTEVKDIEDRRRHRRFQFSGAEQREVYYLTHCRRLGSNRCRRVDGTIGAQFAVWAPNARNVEVVMGTVWDHQDPPNTVLQRYIPVERLAGGYVGDDGSGIYPNRGPFTMTKQPDDVWQTDPNDRGLTDFAILDHMPYMYRIVRNDGSVAYRTDLYSRCQIGFGGNRHDGTVYRDLVSKLDGGVSCSVVINPGTVTGQFEEEPRVWPEREFIDAALFWQNEFTPGRDLPKRVEDLIIYELHIGALGFGKEGSGTLQDALDLLPYLEELGVNAVELLPLSEFGGRGQGWGYATSHYFAIEFSGGGRDQYKYFIRECHRRGIAVIMDVVYNHFAHDDERAERYYDSPWPDYDIYYWYEGTPFDYAHPRHGYLKNESTADAPRYHEEMVRKMFTSSAVALIREFHVDGFRVDQTTSIHAYNRLIADSRLIGAANAFGGKLLREFGRTVRLFKPDVILMAEDHSEWDEVTKPVDQGGQGFDARWFTEHYHNLIGDTKHNDSSTDKLLWVAAHRGSPQALAMGSFAGKLARTGDRKVVFSESHDEAGNSGEGPYKDPDWNGDQGKEYTSHRTIVVASDGAPLFGATRDYAEARCRLVCGVTALSAGTPLFLFGEEVGSERRFKYAQVLQNRENLHAMKTGTGRQLFRFYAAVHALRRRWPGLRSRNLEVLYTHDQNRILAIQRWEGTEYFLIVYSLNDFPFPDGYYFQNSRLWDGEWKEVFNSDATDFGGNNVGNMSATMRISGGVVNCVIPYNGFVVFQRIAD
jgi:1,4-alpha-glucan branching enzyme